MKTPLRSLRIAAALAACAFAATLAHALPPSPAEHVGIYAERGDPARWSVPADTPRLKYDTQAHEARAVLAEELKACRALQAGRSDCVAQANAQHRRDMSDARALLPGSQSGAAALR